jgi:hypothetical protein
VDLSVIICTHNRADDLGRTLAGLTGLEPSALSWEVLVVDNASTDSTAHVIGEWMASGRLPLRSVAEPRLGLSHARNTGLQSCASARALLFLDDDVTVSPGLLVAYAEALRAHPEAGYFGGPIVPLLEDPTDPLAQAILAVRPGAFSCQDLGEQPIRLHPGLLPFGANMCVRQSALAGERFDPVLGYVGRGGPLAEEVVFLQAIDSRGLEGWWVPGATVQHRIPARRATWAFLEKHARATGVTSVFLDQRGARTAPTFRMAIWCWRRAAKAWWHARRSMEPLSSRVARQYDAWQQIAAAREVSRLVLAGGAGVGARDAAVLGVPSR